MLDILGAILGIIVLSPFFIIVALAIKVEDPKGKVIFGVGCGILTMLIRLFGAYPEGVSFAILLMNILTPLIDMYCTNSLFKKKKEAK